MKFPRSDFLLSEPVCYVPVPCLYIFLEKKSTLAQNNFQLIREETSLKIDK